MSKNEKNTRNKDKSKLTAEKEPAIAQEVMLTLTATSLMKSRILKLLARLEASTKDSHFDKLRTIDFNSEEACIRLVLVS